MNMISLELCRRPTQIHETNVTPGARFLSRNPSAFELFPRRLLAKLELSGGRIGRRQDDAHGGALLLRPQVRRGTKLVYGGALVRRAGRLRLRLRRRLVRGDRGGEHQGRNERSAPDLHRRIPDRQRGGRTSCWRRLINAGFSAPRLCRRRAGAGEGGAIVLGDVGLSVARAAASNGSGDPPTRRATPGTACATSIRQTRN